MTDGKLMENLIKTMQLEYKAYSGILEIAEKKTDCLIKNDIRALSAITEEENKAAEKTAQFNEVREQLLIKYCQGNGQDYRTFTLSRLIEQVQEPYGTQLKEIRSKLGDTVKKLSERNGINRKLIENAIKYLNFNMQLMSSPQPVVPLYGRGGQEVSQNAKNSTLDVRF